jgi:hypothetical protein
MHGLYHAVLRSAPGLPTYLSYKINPDIASTDAVNNTSNLPAEGFLQAAYIDSVPHPSAVSRKINNGRRNAGVRQHYRIPSSPIQRVLYSYTPAHEPPLHC